MDQETILELRTLMEKQAAALAHLTALIMGMTTAAAQPPATPMDNAPIQADGGADFQAMDTQDDSSK
jgi:hypothetical protein